MQRGRLVGMVGMLACCLVGASCEGPAGAPSPDDQLNVAPATLAEARAEMERGNQLLANGADKARVTAQLMQIRDQMDRLDGLVEQVTVGPGHVVNFYRSASDTILIGERAPQGTAQVLPTLDLAHLSAVDLHSLLAPNLAVPQALIDSVTATSAPVGGPSDKATAATVVGTTGGGSPALSVGNRVTQAGNVDVVQSALTGADGAYFRNNFCPASLGSAKTVYPFCLPNWSGGAYAYASGTHSHVTIAPFAGGGTVLLSPTVNGGLLATYATFDGEIDVYYAISGWHEVSDGGCCFFCACGEHREIATQTHRWDVSAAGQSFHFGGIFVSDPRNLGFE
jgi:hypothetical protein